MKFWLVKQEPTAYAWGDFVRDKKTMWDGVRNYQARNNLAAMQKGDLALFYHSVLDKCVVGVAQVVREAYPDPTTPDDRWVAIDLEPAFPLRNPVTLDQIKADKALADMAFIKQSRLSVSPATKAEFDRIVKLGGKGKL
ncbi:MAG: EVE domain-containing protein [Deltaproteobacteria bacterium]|nr:EVE domain-containing protein [Deltaproteobacteria bacterium]